MSNESLVSRKQSRRRLARRGSIYVLTLATTMVVAVLALASLSLVRVQRLQTEFGNDRGDARLYAKVAVDMAWHRVQNDASWRSKMAGGTWSTDQAIGNGFYSFTATDPLDGDLVDSDVDPVVIVGVGKSGDAVYKLQAEIRALQPGIRCLEPVVHADNNLEFDGGTATGDHIVSANHDAEVKSSAQVYADAEAANQIKTGGGGVWHGTTTTAGTWPREMPNISTVYDYYTFNGTTINYSDLPDWDENLIDNPGAEDATTSPWYGVSSSVFRATWFTKSGNASIYSYNRNSTGDYPAQDITNKLQNGVTYYTEAHVRTGEDNYDDFTVKLKVVSSGSGTQYFNLTETASTNTSWKKITGTQTITWTGTLTQAEFYVYCDDYNETPYVDDVIMRDDNAPSGVKTIHRKVLSPSNNPFGSGTTNTDGIYVIDCSGGKISIRDSRIFGTLVLLNQNEGGSEVAGSIHWAPAVVSADPTVTNLPALLSNKELRLFFTNTALGETALNANFNPSGTPYFGSTDSDKTDTYPSLINGLIYSEKDIELTDYQPTIKGVLVSDNNIIAKDATSVFEYDPLYYERNAPPGFQASPTYYIVPNSYRQVVD
jgi:hypothetical protein